MDLFLPNQEIQKKIKLVTDESYEGLESSVSYHIATSSTRLDTFFGSIGQAIYSFYETLFDFDQPFGIWSSTNQSWMLINEAVSNGICYGNGRVDIGLFMGLGGICAGFRDYGDYFKNSEIKSKFETRQFETLKRKVQTKIRRGSVCCGGGYGLDIINENSDLIHVDNQEGILYLVQFDSRLMGKTAKLSSP